jgi:hypothetical protein
VRETHPGDRRVLVEAVDRKSVDEHRDASVHFANTQCTLRDAKHRHLRPQERPSKRTPEARSFNAARPA